MVCNERLGSKFNKVQSDDFSQSDSIRDLGEMFDPKLKLSSHIEFTANKTYAMLAFVKRNTYEIMDAEVAKMLYYALVPSNLEFANGVWSSYHQNHIKYDRKHTEAVC